MRLFSIEQVKPPVFLARSIYDKEGKTIVTKGTLINECYINRLKELGIERIYIDEGVARMEIDEMLSEEVRLLAMRHTREALTSLRAGESPESRHTRKAVGDILEEIMLNREVMVHLIDIYTLKDHTFEHSVTVCVLSLLAGFGLKYDRPALIQLGVAALLHDLGKATILDCVVNSRELFEDEQFQLIRKHSEFGFRLLEKAESIALSAAEVALQHHERYNGEGYPQGISGAETSEFARIVAIADVFAAISADRPYRKKMYPHEVIQIIHDSAGIDFDPQITRVFIASLVPFPLGSRVILNDGREGIVVSINKDFPARPRVQLIREHDQVVAEIKVVDLLGETSSFITETICV